MFVLTAKLSKTKLIAGLAVLIAVIVALILIFGGSGETQDAAQKQSVTVTSNDDRVSFLATFGWSVNAEPVQTQKVLIPSGSDQTEVFSRYNELQLSQGYDLAAFAGKEAMRYVYEVLNYPDATEPVYATVLVYDNTVIGGDITCTAPDAPIHGFSMPS